MLEHSGCIVQNKTETSGFAHTGYAVTGNKQPTTSDIRIMKAFECKMCGECCYGKGGIKVSDKEIAGISRYLNIDPEKFQSKYCEIRNRQLMLVVGEDGYCVFFDREKQCLIHEVKPDICYLWPFYEANMNDEYNWDLAKEACPGINPDSTFEEFVKQGKE